MQRMQLEIDKKGKAFYLSLRNILHQASLIRQENKTKCQAENSTNKKDKKDKKNDKKEGQKKKLKKLKVGKKWKAKNFLQKWNCSLILKPL